MIREGVLIVCFADSMSGKASRGVAEKEWSSPGGEGWDQFRPCIGDILEVDLRAATLSTASEGFIAIYITYLEDDIYGGLYVGGKLVGTSVTALDDSLIRSISTDEKVIHLCAEVGCSVEEERILFHCTKARWFQARRFKPSYLAPWGELVLEEIRGKRGKPKGTTVPGRETAGGGQRARETDPLRRARARFGRGDMRKGPRKRKPKEEKPAGGEPAGLREKLDKLRRKIMGQDAHGVIEVPSESEEDEEYEDGSLEEMERGLKTGSGLNPHTTVLAPRDQVGAGDSRDGMVKKEKVKKRVKRVKKDEKLRSRPSSALLAAAEQEEERKRLEKRRKRSRERKGGKEVRALVELLKGGKKRRKSGKDPSSSGGSSSSSEGDSDADEESDSSEMLAPLQKRSSRRPGTVLRMLVKHARTTLDQSSAVDVDQKGGLTSGIRMATYFNLMIRPYHSAASRDMKELHYLSIAMDELRQGFLWKLGGSLASRFLAVHAAVNEGTWKSAQYPLEATQSAPTPVLLEAKKHSRLINKSLSNDEGSWRKGRYQEDWRNPGWTNPEGRKRKRKGQGRQRQRKGSWLLGKRIMRWSVQLVGSAEREQRWQGRQGRQGSNEEGQVNTALLAVHGMELEDIRWRSGFEDMSRLAADGRSLSLVGCILAWMVIHADLDLKEDGRLKPIWYLLRSADAGNSAVHQLPRKGEAFPFTVGGLSGFVEAAGKCSYSVALSEAFVSRWSHDAWLFSLRGAGGKYTGRLLVSFEKVSRGSWKKNCLTALSATLGRKCPRWKSFHYPKLFPLCPLSLMEGPYRF